MAKYLYKLKELMVSHEWESYKSDEVPLRMKKDRNVGGNSKSK